MTATLLWLRQDLRLADHPALQAALQRGDVIPVFIWSPEEEGEWQPGAASRWWLHQSLAALATELEKRGSRLVLRRATRSLDALRDLLVETGATAVYWGRRYEPLVIARDADIKNSLRAEGIEVRSFNTALLIEPWDVQNLSGKPFQVFTPYWRKACTAIDPPKPAAAPSRIAAPARWPQSLALEALGLMPNIAWYGGMAEAWRPGEHGAAALLGSFLGGPVKDYAEQRNLPAVSGTSRLSPHLHFGEISPRQIWHAAPEWRSTQFITEIGWREFAHHLLYHFPRTTNAPLRADFERFPWREDAGDLLAWQHGRTGIPLVDAGMRELWETGWMHNRVRMVVASFLVKNLRMHWLHGARWFWDTLVDADLASNTLGWQWAAGCGADAAPYFRVFNPASQADKFDPQGEYQRRWLGSGSRPAPIVDLKASREAALAAFKTLRSSSTDE
ncbi:MAG: deoxyribodipyrimidine photo-lyase [Sinobacteraceae bacterium]|nr:deoxyribodipyrimidine photo-lyase [Nevskiaceae bacterium]